MARQKRRTWRETEQSSGTMTVTCSSWGAFQQFVGTRFHDTCEYVFRGQRCDNWLLEPTLARVFKSHEHLSRLDDESRKKWVDRHYNEFRYAIRGRRGEHPRELENDYLWALGQHFGLATPLLDWALSPFVAAFFAFADSGTPVTKCRVVFALQKVRIEDRILELRGTKGFDSYVEFFSPLSDENARLVNQGGLFSKCPIDIDMEAWVQRFSQGDQIALFKILVPNDERQTALRSLAQMNINHLSVFPDLHGASQFCNFALAHEGYSLHLGRPKPMKIRLGR